MIRIIGLENIKLKEKRVIKPWWVFIYSSEDLYNWKDEGIALKIHDDIKSRLQKAVWNDQK
jgi:hypothetical protein